MGDDFASLINAGTRDWQTLLVYSDWLRENDDELADGFYAIGILRREPRPVRPHSDDPLIWGWTWNPDGSWLEYLKGALMGNATQPASTLPGSWQHSIPNPDGFCPDGMLPGLLYGRIPGPPMTSRFDAVRAAAAAYGKLDRAALAVIREAIAYCERHVPTLEYA